jgi:hypothetical protein
MLALEIVQGDSSLCGDATAHGDDPGPAAGDQRWHEQYRQGKVPEVVRSEMKLEAIDGRSPAAARNAGVVDEEVQNVVPFKEPVCESAHRSEVGKVKNRRADGRTGNLVGELLGSAPASLLVSAGEHDLGSMTDELSGGFESDSAVCAGDERDRSVEGADVVAGPPALGCHASSCDHAGS